MVSLHRSLCICPETLHLAFNIVDRFISIVSVPKTRLQLLGATAIFVAGKYEEIEHPHVESLVDKLEGVCTRQDVLDMESTVLFTLDFRISNPTSYPFLSRFLFIVRTRQATELAANYYLERSALDYALLACRPSLVAAAAVCLAINHPSLRRMDKLDRSLPGVVSSKSSRVPIHVFDSTNLTCCTLCFCQFSQRSC
jgi:cyclin B